MKIDRKELLRKLNDVSPGLGKGSKADVEQSDCFVFSEGRVHTFNDEVSCSAECDVGVEGALRAEPLLQLLGKAGGKSVGIKEGEGELLVKIGKRRDAGIRMESEVLLPVAELEKPDKWKNLPDGFIGAVKAVSQCVGGDDEEFALACVHLHPKYLEACDNAQIIRWPMEKWIGKPLLVKGLSLRKLVGIGFSDFGQTDSWIHFQKKDGLTLSCRRWEEVYPKLDEFLDVKGSKKVKLPVRLTSMVGRACVFSEESDGSQERVKVDLRPGEMVLTGKGHEGWYRETAEVEFDGELSFEIAPALLVDICKQSTECELLDGRIRVDNGKFVLVCCTGVTE